MQLIKFTLVSLVLGSVFAGQSVRLGVVEERNVSTVSDLASALGSLKTNIENDLAPLTISLRHPITMANVSDVTDALNSVVSDIQEIAPNVESIVSSIVGPLDPKDLTSMISAMGDLQSILNDIEIIILMIIGDFEEVLLGVIGPLLSTIVDLLGPLISLVLALLEGGVSGLPQVIFDALAAALNNLEQLLVDIISHL